MARRIFHLILCAPLAGPMSLPGWATVHPENRVGASAEFPATFASESLSQVAEPHRENPTCDYDFASGVRKYLYANGNPIMMTDPSGHESLASVNFTTAMMYMFTMHEVRVSHAVLTGVRALFGADENVNNIIYGLDVIKTVDEAIGVAALGTGAVYGGFKILNILKGALTGPTATRIANRVLLSLQNLSKSGVKAAGGEFDCIPCAQSLAEAFRGNIIPIQPNAGPLSIQTLEAHFGGQFQLVGKTEEQARTAVLQILQEAGEGSQGIVFGMNQQTQIGHVFNVKLDGGKSLFVDISDAGTQFEGLTSFEFLLVR